MMGLGSIENQNNACSKSEFISQWNNLNFLSLIQRVANQAVQHQHHQQHQQQFRLLCQGIGLLHIQQVFSVHHTFSHRTEATPKQTYLSI